MTSHVMKHNKEGVRVFIAAFILWIATGPFYLWWIPKASIFLYRLGVLSILGLIFYKNVDRLNNKDKKVTLLFVFSLLLYVFASLFNGITKTFLGLVSIIASLSLLSFLLSKQGFLLRVFNVFSVVYSISIIISLLSWLAMMTGHAPFLGMIDNVTADRFYYHYPFVIVEQLDYVDFENMIRFAGPYDEPGVVGTFSSFILYINGYNLRKKVNIICLISGVCSLSFFFAVVTVFFFLCKIICLKKMIIMILLKKENINI